MAYLIACDEAEWTPELHEVFASYGHEAAPTRRGRVSPVEPASHARLRSIDGYLTRDRGGPLRFRLTRNVMGLFPDVELTDQGDVAGFAHHVCGYLAAVATVEAQEDTE